MDSHAAGELAPLLIPLLTGIIAGDRVDDTPASQADGTAAVGMLYITGGPLKGQWGTGTALCPNVVLTAGHVAEQSSNGLVFVTGSNAAADYKSNKNPGVAVKEVYNLHQPGEDSDHRWGTDIALVKLDKPITTTGMVYPHLSDQMPASNAELLQVGYGKYTPDAKWDAPGEAGIRRSGQISPYRRRFDFNRPFGWLGSVPGGPHHNQIASSADSGAPVFFRAADGKPTRITAVHVASYKHQGDPASYDVLVAPFYRQLMAKARDWCDH
jgi:hypothetical protein